MVQLQQQVLASLRRLDEEIAAQVGEPRSLAPGRVRATAMVTLAEWLVGGRSERWQQAFAAAMTDVVQAQLHHFPRNLYWDQDYLAAEMVRLAADPADLVCHVRQLQSLQARFGEHSPIRFRYLHDFSYGFDWARWVARDPVARYLLGPFSPPYLDDLLERGHEIECKIASGAPGFPPVPPGGARNPFPFSREPAHESRLLQDLAMSGLIPVRGWQTDARPRWQLPFGAHREARAQALAIPRETPAVEG